MNTPFGLTGTLSPAAPFQGLDESFSIGDIHVSVKDAVITIGYQRMDDERDAREVANSLLHSWVLEHGTKVTANFSQGWITEPDGQRLNTLSLSATIAASSGFGVLAATVIDPQNGHVVQRIHSGSFSSAALLADKSQRDKVLRTALAYLDKQVTDNEHPFYGIHKAIEHVCLHLGNNNDAEGRKKLAALAGENIDYIHALMETVQSERHSGNWMTKKNKCRLLSDDECVRRARKLIDSYAGSIP